GGEGFSFAFDKNKQKELVKIFDKGIDEVKTNGFYNTLMKKYELE
ncbi:basic amino acid ABC transporter substrate-binding protein, partial [Campylobacter jejuni]